MLYSVLVIYTVVHIIGIHFSLNFFLCKKKTTRGKLNFLKAMKVIFIVVAAHWILPLKFIIELYKQR
jgi:hypothetical protein